MGLSDGSGDQENLFLRNVIPDSGSDVARGVTGCDGCAICGDTA